MSNADCVLTGRIYTSRPQVEGVAICGGKIVYVGDAREAVRVEARTPWWWMFSETGVVLPGFVE